MQSWFLQSSRWKTSCCISAGASPVLHQPHLSCCAPAGTRQGLCGAVKTLQKTFESIRPVLVVHMCASFLIYAVCVHTESGHVPQFSMFVVKFRYNGSCEFLRCWWCEMGFVLPQAEIKSPNALITQTCRKKKNVCLKDTQILLCPSCK